LTKYHKNIRVYLYEEKVFMKNLQPVYFLIILFVITGNLFAQTSENGNWFFHNGDLLFPKSHSAQSPIFPVASLRSDNHKITFSPKEKAKIVKIVEALKEVNPKPKYHSMLYWLFPSTTFPMDQALIDKRQYRFRYHIGLQYEFMGLVNGKLSDKFGTGRFLREWDFLNVNINQMPRFLGGKMGDFGNAYEGSLFELEADFTYKKYNGDRSLPTGGPEREAFPRDESKDSFVSIKSRDHSFVEAAKHLSINDGMPPLKFGNEADNHFVYRRFTSSRLRHSGEHRVSGKVEPKFDKYNYHTVNNMVILSHNNKLPFKPVTIERFLNVADKILDEVVGYYNQYSNTTEAIKKEIFEKNARTRAFIQNLREIYKNRLQEPAIIDSRYSHVSDISLGYIFADNRAKQPEILNLITDKREPATQVASRFFVSDPKQGKAFYTYDRDFYKNMADGEIRTICVIWKDYIRTPDNPDYGKGYSIGKDGVEQNRFSDNPDHYLYHFGKKFDWKNFESVLGK
jgi:hypothetical protein